jgi:hypothetical protein
MIERAGIKLVDLTVTGIEPDGDPLLAKLGLNQI